MSNLVADSFSWADRHGLGFQVALLTCASGGAAVLLAAAAWALVGWPGVAAAVVAWVLCYVGALATVVSLPLFPRAHRALVGVAMGLIVRQAFPLFGGVVLSMKSDYLASGGLPYLLIANYMVTLAIDVGILIWQAPRDRAAAPLQPVAPIGSR